MPIRIFNRTKAQLPVDRDIFLSLLGGIESGVMTTTAIVIGITLSERGYSIFVTWFGISTAGVAALLLGWCWQYYW